MAAAGRDEVVVGIGLPVERQRVADAVAIDVHRLQVVDDEPVFAVVREQCFAVRLAAPKYRRVRVEAGPIEREGVDVGVAVDLREALVVRVGLRRVGRCTQFADGAAQQHGRAEVGVGVRRIDAAVRLAPLVAADADRRAGHDAVDRVGDNVVAHPQRRAERGHDLARDHGEGSALRDLCTLPAIAGQQIQIFTGGDHLRRVAVQEHRGERGVGHRQPDRAGRRARCQQVELAVALGEVDTAVALHVHAALAHVSAVDDAAVDVQVVTVLAHAARVRREVDAAGGDIGQILAVGGIDGTALVEDRARARRQRHVAAVGEHGVDTQVASDLLDVDGKLGVHRQRTGFGAHAQAARNAVDKVGLDEVGGAAYAAGECRQRDVDAADVGNGGEVVVGGVGIDEAARREQEDVVGGRADTADAQVVAVRGVHRHKFAPGIVRGADETVGQDIDELAAGLDVAGAEHIDDTRKVVGIGAVGGADAHVLPGLGEAEVPGGVHRGRGADCERGRRE